MTKIPFTLEAWLKDKSQKVVDEDGRPVRIICTDADGLYPIIGLVDNKTPLPCGKDGRPPYIGGGGGVLFIVTPEPELSEFEKVVSEFAKEVMGYTFQEVAGLRNCARQLMIAAREQFIKDGYVIEKKAFHDAVENISDKHRAEMSVEYSLHCKIEEGTRHAIMNWEAFQKVAQKFIDIGKAEALKEIEQDPESSYAFKRGVEYGKEEALKDLPRWRKCADGSKPKPSNEWIFSIDSENVTRESAIVHKGYFLPLDGLEKLPGFKEDEK